MYTTLLHQYKLVLSAREALFNHCENVSTPHLLTPLATVNSESMVSQLMHVANCYIFWLAKTAMEAPRAFFVQEEHNNMQSVRHAYSQVDLVMNDFLHHFMNSLDQQRLFTRPDGSQLYRSPFEIFVHTTTHEFHHKGQIVNMSRQLGYTPVDTDIIRE